MGDLLSKPDITKHPFRSENEVVLVGGSEMQGWRRTMEDAHTIVLDLDCIEGEQWAFLAVFDGHNGRKTALYCGEHLHQQLVAQPLWRKRNKTVRDIEQCLTAAFLAIDAQLVSHPGASDNSGSTAVVVLIGGPVEGKQYIFCANCGDSRAVLATNGRAEPLSFDHKPTIPSEQARILAAGMQVINGRVNGSLALSRAIGDFTFKDPSLPPTENAVTPAPSIESRELTAQDEFVVLACDGVWDVLSSGDVVSFIREQCEDTDDVAHVAGMLFERCLAPQAPGLGCDNMTLLVAVFKNSTAVRTRHAPPRRAPLGHHRTPSRARRSPPSHAHPHVPYLQPARTS